MTSKTTRREWRGVARYFNRRPWSRSIGHELNGVDVAEKYSVALRIRAISNRSATRGRRTLGVTNSRQTRGNFAVAEPPLRAPRLIARFLWGCGPPISRIYLYHHLPFVLPFLAFEIRGGPRARAINPLFRFFESCLKISFFEREREKCLSRIN